MNPLISIIICTYNGENLIRNCLDSVLNQKFKNFEMICVDGMSRDKTQEIIKNYSKKDKRIKLIINKKQFPEGKGFGKWLGYNKSKGKIVGMIDQDNILQRNDLFESVKKIFEGKKKIIGILGESKHDLSDKKIVRYVSLFGTDSFFAYRSIDFLKNIRKPGKKIILEENNLSITGGNCFFYNKKNLELIGGYSQDIFVVDKLVKKGFNELVIIENSTKHYAESSIFNLIKKKFYWGKTYHNSGERFDYLPKTKKESFMFFKNLFFCLTIFPNLYYSIKIHDKSKDKISFLFPLIAFLNTIAYAITYLSRK